MGKDVEEKRRSGIEVEDVCELRREGWPEGKWEWCKFNELEEARVVLRTENGEGG